MGRPKGAEPARQAISVRLRPATIFWLTAEAEARGIARGELLARIVERVEARTDPRPWLDAGPPLATGP